MLFSQTASLAPGYFASPLDIPLILSGNFGELRSNHFHSGIDIKTEGVEGKKVYCSAKGYISRIKITTGGYGKALYISHPNGYTTVYAHLQKFNDEIEAYVKRAQYAQKSYTTELFPHPSEFSLEKGEIIAISGNSGGSLAPHLHFEIRESKSEKPVNPLLFGFNIADNIPPVFRTVSVYPVGNESYVDGYSQRKDFNVVHIGDHYELQSKHVPVISGEIGFGFEAYDQLNAAHNHCGIYSAELFRDEKLIYSHNLEKFSFYETRYINAFIDYAKYLKQGRRTQRSFVLPANELSIYQDVENRGIMKPEHGRTYRMRYMLKDVYGNDTPLEFDVRCDTTHKIVRSSSLSAPHEKLLKCKEKNSFQKDNVIIYMPPGILYEDLLFNFYIDDTLKNCITPTYRLHDESVPLHSYMMLSIKAPNASELEKRKSIVVSHTKKEGVYPEGGTWKGDYMVVKTRSFGGYAIMLDTVNPVIRPINISLNADMSKKWSIMVKINDALSGIDTYTPMVDGKWILMEYDSKNDMLIHYFDDVIGPGKHTFELTVKDNVGNTSVYKTEFIR